jgi:phosphatidylglycerophosphatase A
MSNADAIASMGGVGLLPIAPGTWASFLIALPAFYITWQATGDRPYLLFGIAAVVFTLLGLLSIDRVQQRWGTDPGFVVIDEAAGMALILATPYAYHSWFWALAAVLLFRLYDIRKPWPISRINDRHEPWAVIADDLLAAVFTIVTLHLAWLANPIISVLLHRATGE